MKCPLYHISFNTVMSCPKIPGQVRDPLGIGNDDFDRGLKFWICGVGSLSSENPLEPAVMKEFGGPPLVESELPAPLVGACGSGPPVEPVTAYFNYSTDPDSKSFKPTDIRLAGPTGYPMPDMGCSTLNSFESWSNRPITPGE